MKNTKNSSYLQTLIENPLYQKVLLSLKFICFDDLDKAFFLLLNANFVTVFIIISDILYPSYYKKLKSFKSFIKFLPICIIPYSTVSFGHLKSGFLGGGRMTLCHLK